MSLRASSRSRKSAPRASGVSSESPHLTAAAPRLGHHHAAPLRDGLRTLQLAFREASDIPDAPGEGPGEKLTGYVS